MTDLTFYALPDYLRGFRLTEAEAHREELRRGESFYEKNGVLYWKSNDAPIPLHYFSDAFVMPPLLQADALSAHSAETIRLARAADRPATEEELAEMRAAFGPGTVVVNVLTGRRTSL